MVGCTIRLKQRQPDWIQNLLSGEFFGECADHRDLRKNEKNMFCIDCGLCFCKHCVSLSPAHCRHRWLQIRTYVYHEVVRLQDIQTYLDCSKIQTYKINGEKAVHLHPRPQSKETKPSKAKCGPSCEACGRHIQDCPNHFCSIACKVSVVSDMYKDRNHKSISIPIPCFGDFNCKDNYASKSNTTEAESSLSLNGSYEENLASSSSPLKPRESLYKRRKGVPRRSPFC